MKGILVSGSDAIAMGDDVAKMLEVLLLRDKALLDDLRRALLNEPVSPALAAQLTSAQLKELRSFFAYLHDKADLNAFFKTLLSPVSKLKSMPLKWRWQTTKTGSYPNPGDLAINLDAGISAAAEVTEGPRYVLNGQARVSGTLKAPFAYGALRLDGSSTAQARLAVRTKHPDNTLVLKALAADLGQLNQLGSLSGFAGSNVQRAALSLTGAARLAAELTAGKSYVISHQASGISAQGTAGITYGVSWAREGSYELALARSGSNTRVTLSDTQQVTTQRHLSVGAELRVSGIEKATAPLMQRISGFPAPLERLIRGYRQPGQLIRKALATSTGDKSGELYTLAQTLLGEQEASVFVADLVTKVVDDLDHDVDTYQNLADGRVREYLQIAFAELGLADGSTLSENLINELSGHLKGVIDEQQAALKTALRKHLDTHAAKTLPLLNRFADTTVSFIADVDKLAERLLATTVEVIRRYRHAEKKLSDAISAVEKQKLTLKLGYAVRRSDAHEHLLDVTIKTVDSTTEAGYRAALTGDFSALLALAAKRDDARVSLNQSLFKRVFAEGTTTGFSLNLFGTEIGFSESLDSRLEVSAANGEVSLFTGTASDTGEARFGKELRTVKTSNALNLAGANIEATGLTVHATYFDNLLKEKELRSYLSALTSRGLLSDKAAENTIIARRTLYRGGNIAINTLFGVSASELKQITQVVNADPAATRKKAVAHQLASCEQYAETRNLLAFIRRKRGGSNAQALASLLGRDLEDIQQRLGASGGAITSREIRSAAKLIIDIDENARDFVALIQLLGRLSGSKPPAIDDSGRVDDAAFQRFCDANRELAERLDGWNQASGSIRNIGQAEFSVWTYALMMLLRDLLQRTDLLLPVLEWQEGDEVRRVAVL